MHAPYNNRALIFVHKGGKHKAGPNSLDAFSSAVELGYFNLETDVRLATDNKLYLSHWATSIFPNRALRLKRRKDKNKLSEIFKAFPNCIFLIDPKHKRAIQPLAELISQYSYSDKVYIGSSFPSRTIATAILVERLTGTYPVTALGGISAIMRLILASFHMYQKAPNDKFKYVVLPLPFMVKPLIKAAHGLGYKVIVWPLNNEWFMNYGLKIGIDGFMTDRPSAAIKLLH